MNRVMGTPQVRCRDMHQSGRLFTMLSIRAWPQSGSQVVSLIALLASSLKPAWSILMNHCGVARKMIGVL